MIAGQYVTHQGQTYQLRDMANSAVAGWGGLPVLATRYALMDPQRNLLHVTVARESKHGVVRGQGPVETPPCGACGTLVGRTRHGAGGHQAVQVTP